MKHLPFSLLLCSVILLTVGIFPVLAQEPESTNSAELRRAIRDRIEQTLQNSDATESPYVGVIGNIEQLGTATFSLTSPRGQSKTVQFAEGTPLLLEDRPIQLNEMVVGNGVTVIGRQLDDLVIEARRVITQDTPFEESRRVVLGTVTAIELRQITIEVRGTQSIESFTTNTTTEYQDIQGTEITFQDIEEDQSILVVTDENAQGQRYIKKLRLLVPVSE